MSRNRKNKSNLQPYNSWCNFYQLFLSWPISQKSCHKQLRTELVPAVARDSKCNILTGLHSVADTPNMKTITVTVATTFLSVMYLLWLSGFSVESPVDKYRTANHVIPPRDLAHLGVRPRPHLRKSYKSWQRCRTSVNLFDFSIN